MLERILRHSFSKYFVVGITAFSCDYLVLLIFYYGVGASLKQAAVLGYLTGFAISFTTNRRWVFGGRDQRKKIRRQIIEYALLVVINLVFTVWFLNFLNTHHISPAIGKLIAMAMIMSWNYVLFRAVIFAGHSKTNL